ncbi:MAG: hypothetical protein NT007_05090 [Candidatus Kapabacteria bacterium]|nr:hypothetical protein [Candidatus Kapabacteria bacterium]
MKFIKRIRLAIACFAIAGLLASCTMSQPICATSNAVGSKTGEVSSWRFLIFDFGGDQATIFNAARQGGISKISTVDHQSSFYLIVFKNTVLVNGD